jgi:hypothetical protein
MVVNSKYLGTKNLATLLFLCVTISLSGCILKRSGGADGNYFNSEASEELVELTKSEVIERLGLPDVTVTDERNLEYWTYKNERLNHFLFFGRGRERNLILEFNECTVTAVHLQDTGSSWNFSLPTLSLP